MTRTLLATLSVMVLQWKTIWLLELFFLTFVLNGGGRELKIVKPLSPPSDLVSQPLRPWKI